MSSVPVGRDSEVARATQDVSITKQMSKDRGGNLAVLTNLVIKRF